MSVVPRRFCSTRGGEHPDADLVRRLIRDGVPDAWVLASETCAFDLIGATWVRDVEPGEIVMIGDDGVTLPFAMPGWTLAMDFGVRGPEFFAVLDELDKIVLEHGGKVYLNGSTQVTKTDIPASNGVIHQINGVLLPPDLD